MARNRKVKYYPCGCCEYTYRDVEMAKGSHYEIGDDDDVPYKRRKKKEKIKKGYWDDDCKHVYVWLKEIHPRRKWVPGKTMGFGKYVVIPDAEPYIYYRHRCIGCNKPKRHSWSYVPPEQDIYQTVTVDAYGNLI